MSTPKPNAAGGSGKVEGRDSWCTPKWLADLIGKVNVDVATNERSHIQAALAVIYKHGVNDGLGSSTSPGSIFLNGALTWPKADSVIFCNPPYAHGEVIKWVRHWRESRFIFLLRWDPSTEWFEELIGYCGWVWFPKQRINFEPPPDVKASSNPFPHALYMNRPDGELLDRLAEHGYLFEVDDGLMKPHHGGHEPGPIRASNGGNAASGGTATTASGSGSVSGVSPWIPRPKDKEKYINQWNAWAAYEPVKVTVSKDELERAKAQYRQQLEEERRAEERYWQEQYNLQFPGYTGWKDPKPV